MNYLWLLLTCLLLTSNTLLYAAKLTLHAPLEYQVIQRNSRATGEIKLAAELAATDINDLTTVVLEVRLVIGTQAGAWQTVVGQWQESKFVGTVSVPVGGWYRLEVRALQETALLAEATVLAEAIVLAEATVEHVGIGEIFVVAGQSNSANHGEERQQTKSRRVATFDGQRWQLSNDPQPGASGGGGSLIPPLGDELAQTFDVPIGFVACGIGATSVREWLPQGTQFSNPPTIEDRVEKLPSGVWQSKGEAFANFVARAKQLGPHGFRAVLWHQGESDANQRDITRTLPGALYRKYLEQLIRESQRDMGWEAPWFVAQVSYHVPGDEASPDIRAAQASLWTDGIALPGPDSDALKGTMRDSNGQGIHFSGPGLREHGAQWAQAITPWLKLQLDTE